MSLLIKLFRRLSSLRKGEMATSFTTWSCRYLICAHDLSAGWRICALRIQCWGVGLRWQRNMTGDHFLPYTFIERSFERWANSTKIQCCKVLSPRIFCIQYLRCLDVLLAICSSYWTNLNIVKRHLASIDLWFLFWNPWGHMCWYSRFLDFRKGINTVSMPPIT